MKADDAARHASALTPELQAWLAATDIDGLHLSGPGVELRLRREGDRARPLAPGEPLVAGAAAVAARVVAAPTVGVYLQRHPQQETPLAAAGAAVDAGQVVGLLRIGALLLPVLAPVSGVVLEQLCAEGSPVGYGTPLLRLTPAAPAARATSAP